MHHGKERRIARWEHEHVLKAAQRSLDQNPQVMRVRRETVEHPFGTMKARMGAARRDRLKFILVCSSPHLTT
jgi:hypothetical protein